MAKCIRCNKFMLLARKSGYCRDCELLNEKDRISEEQRKAAEETERKRIAEEQRKAARALRKWYEYRAAEEQRKAAEEAERKRIAEEQRKAAEEVVREQSVEEKYKAWQEAARKLFEMHKNRPTELERDRDTTKKTLHFSGERSHGQTYGDQVDIYIYLDGTVEVDGWNSGYPNPGGSGGHSLPMPEEFIQHYDQVAFISWLQEHWWDGFDLYQPVNEECVREFLEILTYLRSDLARNLSE